MTAADRTYEHIKRQILTLEREPGSIIHEADLREELQTSRSPVRDALRRLAQEDLVIIMPRQGTLVSNISLSDLHEVFELRLELEGFAAYLAAERAIAKHLEAFDQLLKNAESRSRSNDNNLLDTEIDAHFHRLIYEAASNKYLRKSLEQLLNHSLRLFHLSRTRFATAQEEIPDYKAIAECLRTRDAEKAREWMRAHIIASQERISSSFTLRGKF